MYGISHHSVTHSGRNHEYIEDEENQTKNYKEAQEESRGHYNRISRTHNPQLTYLFWEILRNIMGIVLNE